MNNYLEKYSFGFKRLLLMLVILCTISLLAGCNTKEQKLTFHTEYQAVFLDNGQVYFGHLSETDTSYPLLQDVFYVQNQINPETKQPDGLLIKRGKELHGPDQMRINARHIVMIETVGADSRVAQLIAEVNKKK